MSVHIHRLDTRELAQIQPLFSRVFKSQVSLPLLSWKYADGRGESWAGWEDGESEPSLHCGLLFRDIQFGGIAVRAAQLVDLMASPKRSGLTRSQSPFTQLIDQMLDTLPNESNPHGIAFGFPSARAMRLGEHVGVFCSVDDWLALEFGPVLQPTAPRTRPWHPEVSDDLALAGRLWAAMADDFADFTLGVRDPTYLSWRYPRHPEKRYTTLLVQSRWLRRPMGLAVLALNDGHGEILDLVGRRQDMPAMLQALQHWLAEMQGQSLTLMLTARFARELAPFSRHCAPTEFRIMANPKTPADCLEHLRNHWWLTGGDTDYR